MIGENSVFEGRFLVSGSILIEGKFEGEIKTDEQLTIGPTGRVKTDIIARRVTVGGTLIGNGTIDYAAGLTDAAVGGLLGGSHYAAGVDLSFLDPSLQFIAHFTMGCGNDNLLGKGTTAPVPEPATMLLFGSGITGLAAWQRRKFRKK